MKNLFIIFLVSFISMVTACGGGGGGGRGVPVSKGTYQLTVTNSADDAAIADARVTVFDEQNNFAATADTDANGVVSIALEPGIYTARIQAQGFETAPAKGVPAIPFTVVLKTTTTGAIALDSMVVAADQLAIISGNAADVDNNPNVAGALVVADDGAGNAVSGLTDDLGNYVLFNVPANAAYDVTAFKAGYTSTTVTTSTITGGTTTTVDLDVVAAAATLGDLTGQITFLAVANGVVDITLAHPVMLDTIPGLSTVNVGTTYSLADVPPGTYLAAATFANDGYVMDPDWVNKNGGYPAALEITMAADYTSNTKDFSVTRAMTLVSPTNTADSTEPAIINTLTPVFTWVDYNTADRYVVELFDAKGNSIAGGYAFDTGTNQITFPDHWVDDPDVSATYQTTFTGPALEDGKTYLWRVTAIRWNQPTTKYIAISSSEEQMGLFKVVLPTP